MADDVDAVVVPFSAMGGPAVLSLMSRGSQLSPCSHSDSNDNHHHNNHHNSDVSDNNKQASSRGTTRRVGCSRDLRPLLIVAVGDNNTTMRVTANDLIGNDVDVNSQTGSGSGSSDRGVVEVVHVRSYAECAGVLAAHRGGIRLDSLTSNISPMSIIRL